MKKLNNILLLLITLLFLMVLAISCGSEDGPTDREVFIESITGTWEVTEENAVILNGQDITHLFVGFQIAMASGLTFTTNNDEVSVEEFPWPTAGFFELNDELTVLTRDDGLVIEILLDDAKDGLILEFDVETDAGRLNGIGGGWRCGFTRRTN